MRVIRRISAVLIGFVFFLAGILKLMDPMGARLVVEEYLKFLHLNFLMGASGIIGSGMALLETLVGAALITGVWRRIVAATCGIMLGFFTLLTLLLYIKNPRIDCGCFGEVIHLTHAQSLIKNLILLALWALAFLPFRKIEITRKVKYVSFPIAAVSVCLFLLYSSTGIPLVDFTPFKPGAELMLPEDIDDPTDDRTPTLSISDATGEYVDEKLVEGQLIVISVYDPEKMRANHWNRVQRLVQDANDAGFTPMVLAASTPEMMQELVSSHEVLDATFYADRKKLLTLNRSNGGAAFIQDGLIVTKWHRNSLPDHKKLEDFAAEDVTESLLSENNRDRVKLQGFLLYVFAVMLLM
jgi:triosephosphate isomerase